MRILYTMGEPSGIGPNIILKLHQQEQKMSKAHNHSNPFPIVVGCPDLLISRAKLMGLDTQVEVYDQDYLSEMDKKEGTQTNKIRVISVPLAQTCVPGKLSQINARSVLESLDLAAKLCMNGWAQGVVTGPIHKGIINSAGISFIGHTEYFQAKSKAKSVIMLFDGGLRLALLTTHCSLREVPNWITSANLSKKILLVHEALKNLYGIENPKIGVFGLNPHAGEQGFLGREEVDIMIPLLETLRAQGYDVSDPIPADTAFTPSVSSQYDVMMAMYHDQGLTGLKALAFDTAVNITYGLGFIRTSVDHGTALNLAHSDKVDVSSLEHAIGLARQFANRQLRANHDTSST